MFTLTDDPVFDAEAYAEAQDEETREMIASSPVCCECGRHVAEVDGDWCYCFDGDYFCVECIEKKMKPIPFWD